MSRPTEHKVKMVLHVPCGVRQLWKLRQSHQSCQHTDRHAYVYVVVCYLLTWSKLVYSTGQNCSKIKFQHVFSWLDVLLKLYIMLKKGINDGRLMNNLSNRKGSAIFRCHHQTSVACHFAYRLSRPFCKHLIFLRFRSCLFVFALDYV